MTQYLGIDPGLAHVGWGVITDYGGELGCVAYDSIATSKADPIGKRLASIRWQLADVCRMFPGIVAVGVEENYSGSQTGAAVHKAVMARGVILETLHSTLSDVPVYDIPPQVWKAHLGIPNGGDTRAEHKKAIQRAVKMLLQMDHRPTPHHCADALGLARAAEVAWRVEA